MIDGGVVRDFENPGRKLELGAIRFDPVQHFDERFLREVFSERAISHHAIEQRKHRTLVAAHELPECGIMTLLCPRYNLLIAGGAPPSRGSAGKRSPTAHTSTSAPAHWTSPRSWRAATASAAV